MRRTPHEASLRESAFGKTQAPLPGELSAERTERCRSPWDAEPSTVPSPKRYRADAEPASAPKQERYTSIPNTLAQLRQAMASRSASVSGSLSKASIVGFCPNSG